MSCFFVRLPAKFAASSEFRFCGSHRFSRRISLAISSPRLWWFGHRAQATSLKQQGGRTSEKKRDKQEADRRGRDERSRLPSETFPFYIPQEAPLLSLTTTHLVATPSSYPEYAGIKTTIVRNRGLPSCKIIYYVLLSSQLIARKRVLLRDIIKNNIYF